jgi:DNA-binding winged helix-turn-helix (wHTH) protein/TolB-like protein/tetratricopeptide (TPR) repeat protein
MSRETQARSFYEFGPFVIDEERRRLLRGAQTVPLTKKEFETLLVLVRGSGRVVEKDELMQAVWPDTHVEEGNLAVHVSKLRSKLGRREDGEPYIETEMGHGYRFTAPVCEVEDFDLIIRKRTRSHIVTHEFEETDAPASAGEANQVLSIPAAEAARDRSALAPTTIAASNQKFFKRRGALAMTTAALLVACALAGVFAYRRYNPSRTAATVASVHSIAILPLRALNAPPEDAYIGLGVADNLVSRLGNQRRVIVRPVSAVAKYEGQEQDAVAIGRELQVDAVLVGNFQRSGDRVRIFVQLVNAQDGAVVWARTFDEKLTDSLVMQDAMAEQMMGALITNLSGAERQQLAKRPTENAEAYQLYLKGRYFWNKRGDNVVKATDYFQQAIALDPNFALAYVGLADCYGMRSAPTPEAERAVRRALEIDDTLAEAHASLGFIEMFQHWDWVGAETEFRRAIELNPNYPTAHQWYATCLELQRRFAEAERELQLALALDPLSLPINADICELHFFEHDYGAAINQCRKTLELDPSFYPAQVTLMQTYFQLGTDGQPLDEFFKFRADAGVLSKDDQYLKAFNAAGVKGVLRVELAGAMKNDRHPPIEFIARLHTQLGEPEEALRWLQRGYDEHFFMLPFINAAPAYDDLRSDPRFLSIVRRIGLAQ